MESGMCTAKVLHVRQILTNFFEVKKNICPYMTNVFFYKFWNPVPWLTYYRIFNFSTFLIFKKNFFYARHVICQKNMVWWFFYFSWWFFFYFFCLLFPNIILLCILNNGKKMITTFYRQMTKLQPFEDQKV